MLAYGMRELWRKHEFCDVELLVAEQAILAHKAVLGSQSEIFKQGLAEAASGRCQVHLADVENPEAVRLMLNYLYQVPDEYIFATLNFYVEIIGFYLANSFYQDHYTIDGGDRLS